MKYAFILLAIFQSCGVAFAAAPSTNDSSTVVAGTGKVKFNSVLQAWYLNDSSSMVDSNFRLRRAELKFSGSVVENTRWLVMADPAKTLRTGAISSTNDNKILQDLVLGYSPLHQVEVLVGQFKILTTAESLDPSSALLMPERSLVGRTYGDRREPGFMVSYNTAAGKGAPESFPPFPITLAAMVSNGNGANVDDVTTIKKDLSLRADFTPSKLVNFGAFTSLGDFQFAQKGRVGANVRVFPGNAVLRAEYVEAKDNGLRNRGVVTEAGYTFCEKIQPVLRYEFLRAPGLTSRDRYFSRATSVGANFMIHGDNAKIQASYSILHDNINGGSATGSYALAKDSHGTLFILSFQAAI